MRSTLTLALLLGTTLHSEDSKLGTKAAEFNVQDLSGRAHAFSELKGDVTVLTFISVQCPISNAYTERMNAVFKDYSSKGVKFIFVDANRIETASEIAEHAKSVGFAFPVYRDAGNRVADSFNAQVTPETYVIDSTGVIRYRGAIDDSQNPARTRNRSLRLALDAVISGSPVAIPETKAFGCSIKRVRKTT